MRWTDDQAIVTTPCRYERPPRKRAKALAGCKRFRQDGSRFGQYPLQAYEADAYTAGSRGTPFGHRHRARAKGSGDHSARPAAETPEEHSRCGGANRYAGRQTASHDGTAGPGRHWRS